MSSNQPGPYQSKFLSYAVRQTRQWLDQGRVALRRLAIATHWTAQILLHTVFVGAQAIRLAGAVVKQGIALGMAEPLTAQETATGTADEPAALLTANTPIQHTLKVLQTLPLETELPILAEPLPVSSLVTTPAPTPGTIAINTIARIVRTVRSRRHSPALSLPPSPPPIIASHYIHAIASRLETRTLVLVTNQNQVLDILTPDQQTHLRQRIAWETAHYGRYLRLRQESRHALSQLTSENPGVNSANKAFLPESLVAPVRRLLSAWNPLALLRGVTSERSQDLPVPLTNRVTPVASLLETKVGAIVPPLKAPVVMPLGYSFWDQSSTPDLSQEGLLATSGETPAVQAPSWDYIDVQATPVGYVLAPLEALLRWVDRGLLWLEEHIAHLWQPEQWGIDWQQSQIKIWLIRLQDWFKQWLSQFF